MSGHRKGEKSYFVPRTQVVLQHTVEWYCARLLPNLVQWRQQASSRQGDKTTCCTKFLNNILPWFVEVLVQDGIYLVRDFPNHPMSQLLKVSFHYGDYYGVNNNLASSHPFYLLYRTKYPGTSSGLTRAESGLSREEMQGLLN